MMKRSTIFRILSLFIALTMALSFIALPTRPAQALAAGISDYYIPTSSGQIIDIFIENDNTDYYGNPLIVEADGVHYVIAFTAYMDDTVVYYDHWENGYGFDPEDLTGADETYLADQGEVMNFISYAVPVTRLAAPDEPIAACGAGSSNPDGSTTNCYDGRDYVYVTGGVAASLTIWTETVGTAYALSWAIYPNKPFQTDYTIPVGENTGYSDFSNTFVIVQSTADDNPVTIDDPQNAGVEVSVTLDRGEVTQLHHTFSGTEISATYPVQTLYIAGQYHGLNNGALELRGYSAIPTSLWNNEYFNPVSGRTGGSGTELYIYNPGSEQSVNWYDLSGSGSFTIGAGVTVAFSDASAATHDVPDDSGVRLTAEYDFHVIGAADTG
ncbi:MAG: IgGFc-binding protein, partial [Anaerolineaceae bacterium]|nr:IgGFc-binding protein [Anaerolineaceae bacterium]